MRTLPKFWTTVEGQARQVDGRTFALRMWGWSTSSLADAAAVAGQRLSQAQAKAAAGQELESWKYYPRLPLREEILAEVVSADEALLAVVTRNRYGAEVLNTDLFLIADIDLPDGTQRDLAGPAPAQRGGFFSRFFGRRGAEPQDPGPASTPPASLAPGEVAATSSPQERAVLERIARYAASNPTLGVRTYSTAAGFRVLVTGGDFPPGTEAAEAVLQALDSDPVYVLLCATHQTYRARLTPKPWRCDHGALSIPWPHPEELEANSQQWKTQYAEKSASWATTRLLSVVGPAPSAQEAQVIELHDGVTRATEDLPLA